VRRARELGAFRFNTGRLMRIGTAARHWSRLAPDEGQYAEMRRMLASEARPGGMEIACEPFSLEQGLERSAAEPPATLLVLPNGWVKVAAALPHVCADLRKGGLAAAWEAYRRAWSGSTMRSAVSEAVADDSLHAQGNTWRMLVVN